MKYLKSFEDLRDEYPDLFSPLKDEDLPKPVPGFESGTIDPDDDEPYGDLEKSDAESYKTFLKIVKERNFKEINHEIIINLRNLSVDYCMSIYDFKKHLIKFLNDELVNKYIISGFTNCLTEKNFEGIIEKIWIVYTDDHVCSSLFNLKLKNIKYSEDTFCNEIIVIDKIKSEAHKFNI